MTDRVTHHTFDGYPSTLRLFRRSNSPHYFVRVWFDGWYVRRSTGTEDETKAIEFAKTFYEQVKANPHKYPNPKRKLGLRHATVRLRLRSKQEFIQMLETQNNSCNICGTQFANTTSAYVDHCHSTGVVRSLLCRHCNSMLGFAKDAPEILIRAAEYVSDYREAFKP